MILGTAAHQALGVGTNIDQLMYQPRESSAAGRPILTGVLLVHIAWSNAEGQGRGPALAGVHRGLRLGSIVPDHDVGDRNVQLAP